MLCRRPQSRFIAPESNTFTAKLLIMAAFATSPMFSLRLPRACVRSSSGIYLGTLISSVLPDLIESGYSSGPVSTLKKEASMIETVSLSYIKPADTYSALSKTSLICIVRASKPVTDHVN